MVKHPDCPNCGNKADSKELKASKTLFPIYLCRLCGVIYNDKGKIFSHDGVVILADDFVRSVLGVKHTKKHLKQIEAIKKYIESWKPPP